MNFNKFILHLITLIIFSCSNPSHQVIVLDDPMFVTEPVEDAGMDSIGFLMRKHVIVVTVKDENELHVYNAMNGKLKKSIIREDAFPNGVTTINDQFVLVTERDNKHVAVFNSSLEFLGTFGGDELRSPYGITFYKKEDGLYNCLLYTSPSPRD